MRDFKVQNMLHPQNDLCVIKTVLSICLVVYSINANYNKLVDNVQAVHSLPDFIHH